MGECVWVDGEMGEWLNGFLATGSAFFQVPSDASFWSLMNSPILVALVAATIGWRLNRNVSQTKKELNERVDEAKKELNERVGEAESEVTTAIRSMEVNQDANDADQEEFVEEPLAPQVNVDDGFDAPEGVVQAEDYRVQARAIADEAKGFIEQKIERDTDQRHQRTYAKFSGHHPLSRVVALAERKQISRDEEHALVSLLQAWKRYASGKGAKNRVPKGIYELMLRQWNKIDA
jgi:hypothetical protein